ncbi:MAG: hypothetical protein R3277_00310 [Brumimicrobium sp.]|nr:hypothetical protein [Brumimicrobium sp.]
MKKPVFILIQLLLSPVLICQNAQIPYKEGQTIVFEVVDFGKEVTNNKKFVSLGKGERSKAAVAHNEKVLSGKARGSKKEVIYTVAKITEDENFKKADLQTEVKGVIYTSEVAIFNDTVFFTRLNAPYVFRDDKGDITAVSMLGVEQIPVSIDLNTKFVPYHDYGASTPKYSSYTAERKEHVSTTYSLPYIDYLGRTCQTVTRRYKTISAEVRKEEAPFMHTIHNSEAMVVGTETVEINGNVYTAYLIESVSLFKMGAEVNLISADEKIQKQQIKNHERTERLINRSVGANEDGYSKLLFQKWYVPELGGIVKQVSYDQNGAILSVTKLVSIN